jgi:preprotein translocase subunit SecA
MRQYERAVMLQSLDTHWREHLSALDHLRQGIHLRGYAQKNPTQEYKREAFELFTVLLNMIKTDVTRTLMTVHIRSAEELRAAEEHDALRNLQYQHADAAASATEASVDGQPAAEPGAIAAEPVQPFVRGGAKVGRNDPCPCGSGRKYKQCHGKLN